MRAVLVAAVVLCAAQLAAQEEPTAVFGTTVVIPSGLRGQVYYIHHNSKRLPDFEKMKPKGPAIYTSSLNVPAQDFRQGFPGVTKRVEWFAIDYTGKFWIALPGKYRFNMLSDDGAKVYIDDQVVIDNDGTHAPLWKDGSVELAGGLHRIRVSYFQGPKWAIALILKVAGPGQQLRVFSTDEFKPPPDPGEWRFPEKPATPVQSPLPAGQTAGRPLPNSELRDPDGLRVEFRFHTLPGSVQIYTCKQTDPGFAWSGPDPDAMLTNDNNSLSVHHYKGPTWEAADGSIVKSEGSLAKHFLPINKDAVHWLELPAKEPTKLFAQVKVIHRIDTSGGLPPADKPCDAQHPGDQERVKYGATYLFYSPK